METRYPHKYSHDISDLIDAKDVRKIYEEAKTSREQTLICFLWISGARPSEILELKREDIKLIYDPEKDLEFVSFTFPTKKLNAQGDKFVLKTRQIKIVRPQNPQDLYIETILQYVRPFEPYERLFHYTTRWAQKVVNRLGRNSIGKKLSPYHFRHSALTRESAAGRTLDQLMHLKGAKSLDSVKPYLHARAYDLVLQPESFDSENPDRIILSAKSVNRNNEKNEVNEVKGEEDGSDKQDNQKESGE